MKTNIKGELTSQHADDHEFELTNPDMAKAVAHYLKVSDNVDISQIKHAITPILVNSVAKAGNLEILKKLHNDGADLDAIDYIGQAAIHVVSSCKGREEIIRYLVG